MVIKPLYVFITGWLFGILMLDLLWDVTAFYPNPAKTDLLMVKARYSDLHRLGNTVFGKVASFSIIDKEILVN